MKRVIQYIVALLIVAAVPAAMYFSVPDREVSPRYSEAKHVFEPIEETPNPFRKSMWLNGQWRFRALGEDTWQEVAVPHCWNSIPGLENYTGAAEYAVDFEIAESWATGRVFLNFGAIGGAAEVRLNGVVVDRYSGGFLPLEIEVTDSVAAGAKNTVEVLVDNTLPPGVPEWVREEKEFGGILREVYIEMRGRIHFTDVQVETTAYDGATATVRVTASLDLGNYKDTMVFGKIDRPGLSDPVSYSATVLDMGGGKGKMVWEAEIRRADLWSPDSPAMHSLGLVAICEDGTADGVEKPFAVVVWNTNERGLYTLGGRDLKLRGVTWREQMPGGRGPVVSEALLRKDFERIVKAGFNAVRFAHPPHPAALDLCDRLGIMAVVELPHWRYIANESGGEAGKGAWRPGVEEAMAKVVALNAHHPAIVSFGWGKDPAAGPGDFQRYDYGGGFNAFSYSAEYYPAMEKRILKRLAGKGSAESREPILVTGFGADGIPGLPGGIGRPGAEMNQLYLIAKFENIAADAPRVQGWFIDSLTDYEGPYTDFYGKQNVVHRGLLTIDREAKFAYEHLAGLAEGDPQWRFSGRLERPMPKAELVVLLVLLIVCAAFWQGYISPETMNLRDRSAGRRLLEFVLFGLPGLAIAALSMSFAAGSLTGPVLDPARLLVKYAWEQLWLEPAGARIALALGAQAAWLMVTAVIMSPFLGFRPLAVFELLARCSWVKLLYLLVWFAPGAAWVPVVIAALAEAALEIRILGIGFGASPVKSAALVAAANGVVAALAIYGMRWAAAAF